MKHVQPYFQHMTPAAFEYQELRDVFRAAGVDAAAADRLASLVVESDPVEIAWA